MAMTAARSVWVNLAGTGIIALQQRFADCTGGGEGGNLAMVDVA
jgi:hypothetical protein